MNRLELEWAIMTPEEKAAIMFPDMSTLPLNDKEKKHVYEMFEFEDPDAWRVEFDES
jgi:hypothetical protein